MNTLGLPGIHVPRGDDSDSDRQFTPRWLLDMVGEFWADTVLEVAPFGYDTDPCWDRESSSRAAVTYDGSGVEQDGLTNPWSGRVWLNPPYSNVAPWADLAACHWSTFGQEVLLLVNVSTSVSWFKRCRPGARSTPTGRPAAAVAFFDKRISFIKDGVERKGNDREQMMLWWGPASRARAFRKVFHRVAWIAS